MRKKVLGILLCVMLVSSLLGACKSKDTATDSKGKTVGVCMPH